MKRHATSLDRYRHKRHFRRTPEPSPERRARWRPDAPHFVVHEHAATQLHYDLRLEINGVLVSWAVPKGPSYMPSEKRLAVRTEDHPLAYGDFQGTIPEGEYGGGEVLLWDRGTFEVEPPATAEEGLESGHLTVTLHGQKLEGKWHLVRMRVQRGKENWLLFKARDGQERGKAMLTHPERVLFPADGFTKKDVFDYYRAVADVLVPVLADRPIEVQQWPEGIGRPGFFRQKVAHTPDWVRLLEVKHQTRTIPHINVDRPETLLWLANQSALTLHMWSSRLPRLSEPDWVVFDLDPGTGTFDELITVALALRERLEELGLSSAPKTSGKRGLHVLVPLARGHTYVDVRRFALRILQEVGEAHPELATTERSIRKRHGRIYLDAMQNARGKTVVAPYSLRALDGAPVSTPLGWSEVTRRLRPAHFNLKTMPSRLERVGDLFAPALGVRQSLPRLH